MTMFSEKDNCFAVVCSTNLFEIPSISIYNHIDHALGKIQMFLKDYKDYPEESLPTKEEIISYSQSYDDFLHVAEDNNICIPFKEIYLEDLSKIKHIVVQWFDEMGICPTFKTFESKNNALRYFQKQLEEYDFEGISKYHYVDEMNGCSIMFLDMDISKIIKALEERNDTKNS